MGGCPVKYEGQNCGGTLVATEQRHVFALHAGGLGARLDDRDVLANDGTPMMTAGSRLQKTRPTMHVAARSGSPMVVVHFA